MNQFYCFILSNFLWFFSNKLYTLPRFVLHFPNLKASTIDIKLTVLGNFMALAIKYKIQLKPKAGITLVINFDFLRFELNSEYLLVFLLSICSWQKVKIVVNSTKLFTAHYRWFENLYEYVGHNRDVGRFIL